jgi:tetratricopeptide (TPR) repeat protein
LGTLQELKGKYSAAEPLLRRALSIREALLGPQHPELAPVLSNLGTLQQVQHNFPQAELLYKRALDIWQKAPGIRTRDFAQTLENLGVVYLIQHKNDEAGALFDQAVTIKIGLLGPEHPAVATGLNKVAAADLARGYYTEAESPCQRALNILEKSSPLNYPAMIDALENYAFLLEKTKRKAQAEPLETRAMVYRAKLKEHKGKTEIESSLQ